MLESPAWFWQKGGPWVFCLAFKAAALPVRRAGARWQWNQDFSAWPLPGACSNKVSPGPSANKVHVLCDRQGCLCSFGPSEVKCKRLEGTTKNRARPSSGLPSHREKVSCGGISRSLAGSSHAGKRQFFVVPLTRIGVGVYHLKSTSSESLMLPLDSLIFRGAQKHSKQSLYQKFSNYLKKIIKPYIKSCLRKSCLRKLIQLNFRQYLGNDQILIRTELGFPLIILGSDVSLSTALLIDNIWEPHLTSLFNKKVKSNMTIIDVGANIGYFSALFASKGACVHAFEPNPLLQEILRKNIHINSRSLTSKDVFVNQCAIGSSEEVISMKFPRFITASSSLLLKGGTPWGDLDPGQNHQVDVNIITLDQYSKLNNLEKVDIIKIDVESYEEEVLKGARSLITRQQNLMLCMEYTKGAYSNDFLVQLFNAFSKAYLPEFNNQEIGIQFLKAYEREEILPDRNSLDIMFLKGDHFT